MKSTLAAILCLALMPTPRDEVQAQRTYPFIQLTDEDLARIDLHDGSVGDWFDVLGDAQLTALDFNPSSMSYDPANLDFRIWLAWHDATDRIYVAMERADDVYFNKFSRDPQNASAAVMEFYDSSIVFGVDGDQDRKGRLPFAATSGLTFNTTEYYQQVNRNSQRYAAISETFDETPRVQLLHYIIAPIKEYGNWYLQPPYAEGGGTHFGQSPTISVTEFYVTSFDLFAWNDPAASQVSDLYPGKFIGFTLYVNDVEGEEEFGLVPLTNSFFLVNGAWSTGLLVEGPGLGIPEAEETDSAVEADSWGRIKATFDKETP